VLAPAALALSSTIPRTKTCPWEPWSNWKSLFMSQFLFFHSWKVFAFAFVFVLALCQAAICCVTAVSALTPMAQMKPSSSRPTAVMIFLWSLPAAASRHSVS